MQKFKKYRAVPVLFALAAMTAGSALAAGRIEEKEFSVALPAGFSEPAKQEKTVDSPSGPITQVTYVSKGQDGSAIILGYSEFAAEITDPAETMNSGRDEFTKAINASYTDEREKVVAGYPARSFLYAAAEPQAMFGRADLVVAGPRMYQLIFLGASQDGVGAPEITNFFRSFALTTPAASTQASAKPAQSAPPTPE